ncbi:MAG: lipid-A-disaccharide synthase [Bacteroidales bacterium]|nr:lipid-A-disaccharide synthase [Candidatus Cacconaster merdequi]
MKLYIIAGEASGDLHGSNLIRGLLSRDPSCQIRFWGGDLMSEAGGTLVRHYRDSAVMGFVEILSKLGRILGNLSFCKKDIMAFQPDAVVLVDYPGFNLKIARFAHSKCIRVYYYIAPKVWAHGEGRIAKLKKYVDRLFVIFPFEVEYFRKRGIEVEYYGNPLLDAVTPEAELPQRRRMIALLAGSRHAELKFLMPRYVELAKMVRKDPALNDCELVLAGAPSMSPADYASYLPEDSEIKIEFGKTVSLLHTCTAAVVANGTANLEAAVAGAPQVSCYAMNAITFLIAKRIVKIDKISLPNIIMGRHIIRELIQDEASSRNMYEEVKRLVSDAQYTTRMKEDYASLREILGGGGASLRIADAILSGKRIQ